ncbi:MAG: 2-oxoglutarate dehydrogenase E1 component [Chitinophagales bacterium]|jgi:2-oxoglutarate dehydrogenase E1 component
MQKDNMAALWSNSHISGGNAAYVEALYETFLVDPNAVDEKWRDYFDKLPRVEGVFGADIPHSQIVDQFAALGRKRVRSMEPSQGQVSTEYERKQVRVIELIDAYRQRGHQKADLDPLGLAERQPVADLELQFHGLTGADLDIIFQAGTLNVGKAEAPLRELVEALDKTYCGTVGTEFMHIVDTEERMWIQSRLESVRSAPDYSAEVKTHLLERLTAAEGLEKYLGSRYPGTKRFGLEGGESLIPMMDELVQRSGSYDAKEIVIGMAHRGRLNVLINIFGKNPAELFNEFEGKATYHGSADVKYHQGFSSNVMTPGGEVHLALAFNPSHLEIVSPVVEGSVRARQDRRLDMEREKVIPIVLHGDAAFAGQGVVMETFQMSQTRAHGTGGTVHIVINNQVGFTTSRRDDIRSTEYCTDVAKMVQAPIFHVNADDPEAVLFVTQVALDYRQEFKGDVVIDLICYRRRGHNEADEPSGTQPLMYQKIKKQPTTRDIYAKKLVAEGVIADSAERQILDDYRNALDNGEHVVKALVLEPQLELHVDWTPYLNHKWNIKSDTSVSLAKLQDLSQRLITVPEGFAVQAQVKKILEDRKKMGAGAMSMNWGFAESLAYASLVTQDMPVRLIGQDSGRGTFSHRHAVLHNQRDGSVYVPTQHLADDQAAFTIHDSLLSEEAALAFEYGYATTMPEGLVIWEAQFGDFANGAQVVIDQFITSGEHKWARLCGLTMLLPHGYEGQGPEHSSARLERFLQLCAEHNMQVCVPTTPAQIFHLLRRQSVRPLRKPLVVFTPKSLLRHKEAISELEELTTGGYQNVIGETDALDPAKVTRLVMCSGKVYYELRTARREANLDHVVIIRIEQLYPFPDEEFALAVAPYENISEVVWCQEEPQNQGVWYSSKHHFNRLLDTADKHYEISYAGREASASPAAGYAALHLAQQKQLIEEALGLN